MRLANNPLNIIYVCHAEKGPSGGGKTIYNHSDLINKLRIDNLKSEVLHIGKRKVSKWNTSIKKIFKLPQDNFYGWKAEDITVRKNFRSKWFNNNIILKENFIFNKDEDFVIFPEIFAHFSKKLCIEKDIPYAIFVQNGYCLNSTNDYRTLNEVYKNAKFILSYSKDITRCINLAFKNCENKILKTNISVDNKKFNFKIKKTNTITYMPRKLPHHSDNLIFFLKDRLPKGWRLKALLNLTENKVYENLLKSKIFLSFSDMEGLGFPPIEAAMAGNKVIGYPGQGGKEYWKKPIFTEIPNGNISKFINQILLNIKHKKLRDKFTLARKKIINKFSRNQEKNKLIYMIKKIRLEH